MSEEENKSDKMQLMVDLLRSGAILTDLSCPACASPLFRLKSGELWCAQCQKKVIVVKKDEEARDIEASAMLSQTESTIMMKIWEMNERLKIEDDPNEIQKLSIIISTLLENLEKIRRIEKRKE